MALTKKQNNFHLILSAALISACLLSSIITISYAQNADFLEFSQDTQRTMEPMTVARLQTLDKITGRTETRNVKIGETVQFGPLYGVVRACRKTPPIEEPEAAAFIQIWEPILSADQQDISKADTRWVFSGWMFASSPSLSAMDHPIYDIWVLDCLSPEKPSK